MKTNMAQSDQVRSLLLRFTSFDNLLWSMLTTFQLITLDYWENVYNMVRAISDDDDLYIMLMLRLFVCHVSSSSNFFPFLLICSTFSQFVHLFPDFSTFHMILSNFIPWNHEKTTWNHGEPWKPTLHHEYPPGTIKTNLEP